MPKEKDVPRPNRGEIWTPVKPGDFLVGVLERIRETSTSKFGRPSRILDLRTPEGLKSVFCDTMLTDYAAGMVAGRTYKLLFLGWGVELKKQKSDKNRFRSWKVTELVK